MQDESAIKPRSAAATRPGAPATSRHRHAAARALVDISYRAPRRRQQRCSDLIECRPGDSRNSVRDAVVPMLRVPAEVAVEPVAHVQELLGNYHLERPWLRAIDARQVDQDEMMARCGGKRIGATDRAPHAPSQPAFEDTALGSDPKAVSWQIEERDVSFEKPARFLVIDQPVHDDSLQGDGRRVPGTWNS